ncbi:2TM domain-containing protein [Sediminibacterium soli]|uniref:2TM domain-containing protein n=1 Tax=Sediminibacterium soli TaxID=2698829 RepID=UPI00137A926D|nr:2TM domain-containing protein [Sediminibacterium soli]NCI45175.1 2TM domain-containing protein [Sediminibacterium soli]
MEPSKDQRLWRMAQKRASFKKSLYSYLVICAFFWAIWWITTGRTQGFSSHPWPVWVMLGWGVALGFQYFDAYSGSKEDLAEEEYERLKRDQGA